MTEQKTTRIYKTLNPNKMKKVITLIALAIIVNTAMAQKFKSSSSEVTFFSEATLEDIAATNKSASSVFDASSGSIVFSIPIDEFQFEKSLMQEHFNEKYMESEKYPKSIFKGKIIGYTSGGGKKDVEAEGELTIHGVTRKLKTKGQIEEKNGQLYLNSTFIVKLEDHKVKIPKLMWQNIAEQVEVKVSFVYKAL